MEPNVGGRDRAVRMIAGVTLALAGVPAFGGYLAGGDVVSAPLGGLGGVSILLGGGLFVTGLSRKCPINGVAGVDTTE